MFLDNAFVTVMNAQAIANVINHYYTTKSLDYFKLEVEIRGEVVPYWVRPILESVPSCIENVSEVVKCETDTGLKLSLLIPRRHRDMKPATAVFASSTGSAG